MIVSEEERLEHLRNLGRLAEKIADMALSDQGNPGMTADLRSLMISRYTMLLIKRLVMLRPVDLRLAFLEWVVKTIREDAGVCPVCGKLPQPGTGDRLCPECVRVMADVAEEFGLEDLEDKGTGGLPC